MVIDHIQQKIIWSEFFKVWVMSLHCSVPLDEFKGNGTSVFCLFKDAYKAGFNHF
jgi:hypothetical protein